MGADGSAAEESDRRRLRLTFDRAADSYEHIRPSYPAELFDELFAALPADPHVIEMGPGSGQATSDLLARGATVTAVEIAPRLATRLAERLGSERLTVINDEFETAALPLGRADAVVAATAWHWVSDRARVARPAELLRPGGVIGIIDLIQVASEADRGYFDRVQPIYVAFGSARHDHSLPRWDEAVPPMVAPLAGTNLFENPAVHRVRWDQTYTAAEYRRLLMTYSGTLAMPEPERTAMVDQLVAVIDEEYDGTLTRPLVATLTTARRR